MKGSIGRTLFIILECVVCGRIGDIMAHTPNVVSSLGLFNFVCVCLRLENVYHILSNKKYIS